MSERKINSRTSVKGDVMKIKTDKKFLKELGNIIEIRVLDMKGNLKMKFWKGEAHE